MMVVEAEVKFAVTLAWSARTERMAMPFATAVGCLPPSSLEPSRFSVFWEASLRALPVAEFGGATPKTRLASRLFHQFRPHLSFSVLLASQCKACQCKVHKNAALRSQSCNTAFQCKVFKATVFQRRVHKATALQCKIMAFQYKITARHFKLRGLHIKDN
mmetsp:Transcript_77524/g.209534  ORF Transcript_77524/g.209534 Transcript_77524/m.209534 type:complete len:160 (-) Transcript_77524:509-988(-)